MAETAQQPSSRFRLTSIEAGRGVAATLVLANHCFHTLGAPVNFGSPPFGLVFQFGRSGADLFFVLSGFLIAFIHWGDIGRPERLRHYIARRVTRIYPTYWLVLAAIVPVDIATHTLFDHYDQLSEVLKSVFLLPQNETIIDVSWSLRNELLFYALFGLLIFNRRVGAIGVMAWMAMLAAGPFFAPGLDRPWINMLTYPMNFEFVAGAAAGWALRHVSVRRPMPILLAGLAIFVVFAVAEDRRLLWTHEAHLWFPAAAWNIVVVRSIGYGAAAVFIVVGLSALEMQQRIRAPRIMIRLGEASYLLYLIHVPALLLLAAAERHMHLLRFVPAWLLASIFIVLIIAAAMLANKLIEQPMLSIIRPRRTVRPARSTSAPA